MANEQYQDNGAGEDDFLASFSVDVLLQDKPLPLPALSGLEFVLWIVGRRSRHRIEGRSMLPLLLPGDEVLYSPQAYERTLPQVGDVVIVKHPEQVDLIMIKRIGAIKGRRCWLLGDNRHESTDSRSFGWVEKSCILGRVTCSFS